MSKRVIRKHTANKEIREAMKAKGIGQVKLAEMIGYTTTNLNLMLQKEVPWNIREAILETIRRYDPDTNPMGQ